MILATFVPIPGRCHGGWSYEPLTERYDSTVTACTR
jgi:hypothetical protein